MASKFSEFLKQNQIDPRRLIAASRIIERLRPEDRRIKLEKRLGKGADAAPAAEGDEPKAPPKPRTGRPVTRPLLARAEGSQRVSGPEKQRLLRAVNRVLEQKKKDSVDLKALF